MKPRPLQLPRGRRSLTSIVTALVVIAAAALSAIAAIQIRLGRDHTVLGDPAVIGRWLRTHEWPAGPIIAGGIVLAALGLLLLYAAIVPPHRTLVRLADPGERTVAGITKRGLRRDITSAALSVDGITRAKVDLGRRKLRVSTHTDLRDTSGLGDAVTDAVKARLDQLAPDRPLRIRTRVRGKDSSR